MKPSIASVAGHAVRFAAVCAAACALGSCSFDKPLVGLLVYNETDPYMETFAGQILAAAEGFFPVKLYYAGNSQLIQNEQIEKILSEKPDVLMINPVDRLGAYAIIRRLQAANVPVIFFNREPLAGDLALWDKTYYVGARAEQSGQMQARLVMDLFGNNPGELNQYDRNGDGKIQTIILKGEQGHQDAETRTSEVLYTFEKNGFAVETLALEVANWNRDEAYTKRSWSCATMTTWPSVRSAGCGRRAFSRIRTRTAPSTGMTANGFRSSGSTVSARRKKRYPRDTSTERSRTIPCAWPARWSSLRTPFLPACRPRPFPCRSKTKNTSG